MNASDDTLTLTETQQRLDNADHYLHGVHLEWQVGFDYFTAVCGRMCFPDEESADDSLPACSACWADDAVCPVCDEALSCKPA